MTRWDVCNAHLRTKEFPWYLEIGAAGQHQGRGGKSISAMVKIGVDIQSGWWQSNYDISFTYGSDAFFERRPMHMFDVVLVDGLHHVDQVFRDIENSYRHLVPDGLIVVHDCNPQSEPAQRVPRPDGKMRWNGDVWKAIVTLRAQATWLHVETLDTDEGLGLIRRAVVPSEAFSIPFELTWEGLVANRQEWLGLKPVEAFACR